jgi:hypothetical protein
MSCPRRRKALLAALLLAGCGSSGEQAAQPPAAGTATAASQAAAPAGPNPCVAAANATIGVSVTTSVTDISPGQATCVYRSAEVTVKVQVDTNPQAETRFSRAVVERGQNAVWGHNQTKAPVLLHGLGAGADWFPADRELLTTDGKRLISVLLVRGGTLKLSRAIARATLSA